MGMPGKNLLSIRGGFPDLGARGGTFRLPLVEQENRRQSFLPPDLQPWRIFDTQITPEREAQLWLCRCGAVDREEWKPLPCLGASALPETLATAGSQMCLPPQWTMLRPGVDGGWPRQGRWLSSPF